MVFVRVTGRAIVNVHSANTEGSVGNYSSLSKMFIVRRTEGGYEVSEDAVISGNMLKHWHAVRMVELLKELGNVPLCDSCKRFIMYRTSVERDSEFDYVTACAIEDLHGFLFPDASIRRESLVKFSFLLPVEELRSEYSAITHNRVVLTEEGKIPAREQAMMVFKREHASALYGFAASMDLKYVGRSLADPENQSKVLGLDERKVRAKAAVLSLLDVFSGRFGAAASRALPIMKLEELVCAVSPQPLPNLVHGFYGDYLEESGRVLKAYLSVVSKGRPLKVFASGERVSKVLKQYLPDDVLSVEESAYAALVDAAKVVEEWLK
ncbi:MAG: type I-A CRISPR-associated protein Cas7/Csa2 [Thermofilaceae archaeon]|nr:type I-A CRISPR-associated protein Cas7/Csa2 [Thermofilaceae archaeon]MCX8181398.1 type I-A CRISPR-associated protein Cas7/Csa2 [Thermofilaceae archaeon]